MNLLRHMTPSPGPSDGIRRVGFRKWYERELLSSHAYMMLAFLSFIAVAASFEAIGLATGYQKMLNLFFVVLSAGIGLWAIRRYLFLLLRAEGVANQASCGDCGTYGRFTIVAEDHSHCATQVRCSKREHLWTICT